MTNIHLVVWFGLFNACLPIVVEGDQLYDTLCNTDVHNYAGGIGAYCGGEDVWTSSYDLQVADDFPVNGKYFITSLTADYLTVLGFCPDRLCWSVYPHDDAGCRSEDDAVANGEEGQVACTPFEDTWYDLKGQRVSVVLSTPPFLSEGRWFLSIQPSSRDWGYAPLSYTGGCEEYNIFLCATNYRDGGERNRCCDGLGVWDNPDWQEANAGADYPVIPMRVEGIAAGDCADGEIVSATCKVRDGGRRGCVVVKVSNGQPNGAVTALLDPPDPQSISISLDSSGRGKGKFRGVALGEHRVFVCDSIVDVTCSP